MLDPRIAAEIRSIIRKHLPDPAYKIFVFGSRAEGDKHRKFSDVDIGILGPTPVPIMMFFDIEDSLENSDIPYIADLVDFSKVSNTFKQVALSSTINLE
ncbi:MAG: DNA polymerase, beta-like region [Microgenomates group bacterium Gr01-1014_16]|nr:MAG: DNA polymerase, beta-like region [Microgenomates group bacterium Gr01-1014_16]